MDREEQGTPKTFAMKTIAAAGMSPRPERPSHNVSQYMSENGYNIMPVNPGHRQILHRKSHPTILDIVESIDIVKVFRRAEYVHPIRKEARKNNAKAIWLQDGVISHEGEKLAKEKEILSIMNDGLPRRQRQINA
jgi:Predicted CoA-binding protein